MSHLFTYHEMHLAHEGGTKDYDIFLVVNESTNQTVMLRRWGRVGTDGQVKVMFFNHHRPAQVYAQKIINDKLTRGYSQTKDDKASSVKTEWLAKTHMLSRYLTDGEFKKIGVDLTSIGGEVMGTTSTCVLNTEPVVEAPKEPVNPWASRPAMYGSW